MDLPAMLRHNAQGIVPVLGLDNGVVLLSESRAHEVAYDKVVRPTTAGSPPKRCDQMACEMTASRGPFGTSSAAVNGRPTIGAAPRTANVFAVTCAYATRSGSPLPVMLICPSLHAATSPNARSRLR